MDRNHTPVLLPTMQSSDSTWEDTHAELTRYCVHLTRSRCEAEDVVQDTLLKLLPIKEEWRNHPAPKAFMFRIARQLWMDQKRREVVYARKRHELITAVKLQEMCIVDGDKLEEAVSVLVNSLTELQRTVFLLKEAFGLRISEIAQQLHTSEGAVKAALNRARKTLREVKIDDEAGWNSTTEHRKQVILLYARALQIGDVAAVLQLMHVDGVDEAQAVTQLFAGSVRTRSEKRAVQHNLVYRLIGLGAAA